MASSAKAAVARASARSRCSASCRTRPAALSAAQSSLKGRDLLALSNAEMREVRGNDIAMVFQEPMSSLNPVLTVGRQITEALEVHLRLSKREADSRAAELLHMVGIPDAADRLKTYPHQFSGGMRQRVMIAMALSCNPRLVIADEPTTALDVTIQAQILELLQRLSAEMGTAVLIITHNLGVIARYASRVNVMYAGKIVESGTAEALFSDPQHPYTRGLLQSVPRLNQGRGTKLSTIEGTPPDLAHLPYRLRLPPPLRLRHRPVPRRDASHDGTDPRPRRRLLGHGVGTSNTKWRRRRT